MAFERHVTRRAFLRFGSQCGLAATAYAMFATPRIAGAEPIATRMAWEQIDIPLAASPYVSPPLHSDTLFNAVETNWDAGPLVGPAFDVAVRTSNDGASWTPWQHVHSDTHARDLADGRTFGDLLIVAPASFAQFSLAAPGASGNQSVIPRFRLTTVNTLGPPGDSFVHTDAVGGITIVPRAGWGADEKIRLDKDGKEIWPAEYRAIKKVIVHHTVTRDPETDSRATLRAIYQYHAVSRGWGDIGYNFLIDQQGTIYEGRYGGDRVVGGHALQYNWGSIGIAILGTYQDHSIPDASRTSLLALIRAKAADLDPVGKGFFIDRDNVSNISGHRGVLNTSCPGDTFYPTLNNLRRELKGLPMWTGAPKDDPVAANPPDVTPPPKTSDTPSVDLISAQWGATSIFARDLLSVRLTVKNSGAKPLTPSDPPPDFVYAESDTYAKRGYTGVKGGVRVAIGPELMASSDPPYRWGLGKTLQPGESVTLTVAVRMATTQRTRFVACVIADGGGPLDSDDAVQISVQPNPVDPATASTDANMRFFPETKHNIGPDFLAYWRDNGGLAQFGYPVTELFSDMNPDDKTVYKVQYFERARFELHPEKAGTPYAIELGRLGAIVTATRLAEKPFARVGRIDDAADRRYFPDVGHTLSGTFKAYWDGHGGLPIFGFPVCEPFDEKSATDGHTYTVQYFERNRFEFHPETNEVLLGLLGSEVLRRRGWLT